MKKKLLLKAMAVTLSAVCLAGCSQKPADEPVADTEVTTTTTSTTTESVTETESSTAAPEVQITEDICEIAKEYGMTQVSDRQEIVNLWGGFDSTSAYYVAKDSNEATFMYSALFNLDAKTFPDIKADELVMCLEKKTADSNGKSATTEIYKIKAADSASAQELYNAFSQKIDSYEYSSGEVNGYTYTIGFYGSEKNCVAVGTFLKDDTVIRMLRMGDSKTTDDCIGFFCDKFGFVSPMTLKKNG